MQQAAAHTLYGGYGDLASGPAHVVFGLHVIQKLYYSAQIIIIIIIIWCGCLPPQMRRMRIQHLKRSRCGIQGAKDQESLLEMS